MLRIFACLPSELSWPVGNGSAMSPKLFHLFLSYNFFLMEEQGDIPLAVWAWNGHKLVIVWGVYALNALRKSAQKLLPGAIANNRPSVSGEFEILVFTKIDGDKYDLLAYGGTPVLCYNVLSSIMPSTNVFTRLMNHFKQSRAFPTIWAFNPHVNHKMRRRESKLGRVIMRRRRMIPC